MNKLLLDVKYKDKPLNSLFTYTFISPGFKWLIVQKK